MTEDTETTENTEIDEADQVIARARENFERVLGEVTLFLSGIPPYDELFLEELPQRIFRPLMLKQFEIVRSKDGLMIGYTTWAMLPAERAARYEAGDEEIEWEWDDWNSGDKKVIVDQVGVTGEFMKAARGQDDQ